MFPKPARTSSDGWTTTARPNTALRTPHRTQALSRPPPTLAGPHRAQAIHGSGGGSGCRPGLNAAADEVGWDRSGRAGDAERVRSEELRGAGLVELVPFEDLEAGVRQQAGDRPREVTAAEHPLLHRFETVL